MGQFGPIPNRSDQKVRRNVEDVPITTIDITGPVPVPDLGIKNPHPLVEELYESLRSSGQARFYEPSDWAYAKLTMHFINKLVRQQKPSAMMLSSVLSMMTPLLMTEGERRRVRIEVERNKNGETPDAKVISIADRFRDALTQPQPGSPGAG